MSSGMTMLAVSSMAPPVEPYTHKRPKLSLQTTSLSINFGCPSRELSTIVTPSAAITPTTLNTFNNTYDLTYRPTPTSATESVRSSRLARSQSPKPSRRHERSYHLPYGVKSILKNSDVSGHPITASPLTSTRKVFFPQPKKVSFKRDLEEEITTEIYVARHSDLMTIASVDGHVVESVEKDPVETCEAVVTPKLAPMRRKARQSCPQRQKAAGPANTTTSMTSLSTSSPVSSTSTSTRIIVASSPPAKYSTRKRRRWEWTLSPVNSADAKIGPNRHSLRASGTDDRAVDTKRTLVESADVGSENAAHVQHAEAGLGKKAQQVMEVVVNEDFTQRPAKRRAASIDVDERAPSRLSLTSTSRPVTSTKDKLISKPSRSHSF